MIDHLITGWTALMLAALGVVGYIAAKVGRLYERREWEHRSMAVEPTDGERGSRMRRLEQAVESIAVELERLSEGQRFVTKLLVERGGEPEKALRSPQPDSVASSPRPPA